VETPPLPDEKKAHGDVAKPPQAFCLLMDHLESHLVHEDERIFPRTLLLFPLKFHNERFLGAMYRPKYDLRTPVLKKWVLDTLS
jgi:hypothetical protein